jgi:hypothetical protein
MCFLYKNEKEGLDRIGHMTGFSVLRANGMGGSGLCAHVMCAGASDNVTVLPENCRRAVGFGRLETPTMH